MEAICVKLDDRILKNIEIAIKKHNYTTKTDFIREAIRDKLNSIDEKDMVIKALEKFKGSSNIHVSDKRLHEIREEVAKEYAKKFGIELD